jgi:hypothetical protein
VIDLHFVDAGVLLSEGFETITELVGFDAGFSLDLTSEGTELINVLGSLLRFDRKHLNIKCFLGRLR